MASETYEAHRIFDISVTQMSCKFYKQSCKFMLNIGAKMCSNFEIARTNVRGKLFENTYYEFSYYDFTT